MYVPTAGQRVELRFEKLDGSPLRRFGAAVLGVDEYGVWVTTDADSVVTWPDGSTSRFPKVGLTYIPTGTEWWTVMWVASDDRRRTDAVYGNISLPPRFERDRIQLVDLDLDVVRSDGGALGIVDWDEFAANAAGMAYPNEVREGDRAEPYYSVVDSWFEKWRDD